MSNVDRREGDADEPQPRTATRSEIALMVINCAVLVITIAAAVRIGWGLAR